MRDVIESCARVVFSSRTDIIMKVPICRFVIIVLATIASVPRSFIAASNVQLEGNAMADIARAIPLLTTLNGIESYAYVT